MRVFIATFLVITMLFNLFAGYTSHVIKIRTVRRQMERLFASIEPGKTKCLNFTIEEFENLQFDRNGEEFSLNGNKYDILKVEKTEGGIIVHAFEDEKETGQIAEFLHKFKEDTGNKGNKSPNSTWLKVLQTEYIPAHTNTFTAGLNNSSLYLYPNVVYNLSERALIPLCPPPNCIAA